MIDFIIKKIPLFLFCLLFIFNFFLKMYLSKLIKSQIGDIRCTQNVSLIKSKIQSISRILTVSKFIQTLLIFLYLSKNKSLKQKIFNVLEKIDNVRIIKYILYISIFILYILMLTPLSEIKSLCDNHTIGKNMFYIVVNWFCISFIILLLIIVVVKKFKTMKNNDSGSDYDSEYDSDDDLNFI